MTSPQADPVNHYSDIPGNGLDGEEIALTPEETRQAYRGRVATLEVQLAETRDLWMRAEAENANIRARAKRDVDEAKQFATQRLATEVVEAADNLHRGLDSVPRHNGSEPSLMTQILEGFGGVERSFVAMLERNGIKRVDPTGNPFDAASHQAMGEQESSAYPPGTVLRTMTPVWTLNGRLLRPAMVVVAKHA